MDDKLRYWLKGEDTQNFGDYLSEFLADALFYRLPSDVAGIHVIGSVIDAAYVPDRDDRRPVVFWGGGVRSADGLSVEQHARARILAVRGPLSAAALHTPDVPQGDPALLLPALYTPRPNPDCAGRSLCVPHFFDKRGDEALLALSGCEAVLRPNLPASEDAVRHVIDAIAAADFVLTAALHAAIVAAAYGRPFAFWDPGEIDVPIKWEDFAASVGIPCVFQTDVATARTHHARDIRPVLTMPPLWKLLTRPPMLPRPEAVLKVLRFDLARTTDRESAVVVGRYIDEFTAQQARFARLEDDVRAAVGTAPSDREELEALRGKLRAASQRLVDIEHSTSWRLTAPLRLAGARMKARQDEVSRQAGAVAIPPPPSAEALDRRRSTALSGATDLPRWTEAASYDPHWDERALRAAGLLAQARWVCDIGCGPHQALRAALPARTRYLPADLRRWTGAVAFCDINAQIWPHRHLACCDAVALLGVLEYIRDPGPLLRVVREAARFVVLSYHPVDAAPADRHAYGWTSAWTTAELERLLLQAGFERVEITAYSHAQILLKAHAPAPGAARRISRAASRLAWRLRPVP